MNYITTTFAIISVLVFGAPAEAAYHFADYTAHPPLHIYTTTGKTPQGITPEQIKTIYNLPQTGGSGTIAIIGAYNNSFIEKDLADFDAAFNLPGCTTKNGCLTIHKMSAKESSTTSGWELETALDVEWAHAIAPKAKIELVEAATPSGANLLKAVDYAAKLRGIRAVAMSWGGAEFSDEITLDKHFESASKAPFFAAAGDSGAGVSWPAVSPKVIAVGGTSFGSTSPSASTTEVAWSQSGGGVSEYELEPVFQKTYGVPKTGGKRAVPDVAYNADPASGFPIVHNGIWRTVGGTSVGAPQWAAIASLASSTKPWSNSTLYLDAKKYSKDFNDITKGANGTCGTVCEAHKGYDFVTGLGSPRTSQF